jgi:pre-60S factor REI1
MKKTHSFFISEQEYCKNIEGLLLYLGQKINIGLLCLYCENKGTKDFKNPQALQNHMMDKGHCFMNTENFEEYAKYYDFSEQIREFAQLHQNNNKNYEEAEIEID